MKQIIYIIAGMFLFAGNIYAQEVNQNVTIEEEDAEEQTQRNSWRPLFGTDLSDASYDPEAWSWDSGILTATKDEAIWTTVEYENFELDVDFRNESGTNSGIVFYCTDTVNWIPNSVEIQIADDHYPQWSDAKPYERCGAVYGHLGPRQENVVRKPGEWNHIRVKCVGQNISVILNGKKLITMDMSKWTSGSVNPDESEIPEWLPNPLAEMPTKGYIGLQGKHGDAAISFRNVKIRNAK
ncbi:DUF1080 domain-containing protein [Parabacteroides sp. OttesenSCG-928-G07]|nr:DUF1080 domain-containing protein [Parabacteroides sp. OttesenSCG-928-G21]MDL2277794.1 DUF1080 domain-containing protein [Parabacteroides sp. OttesenSCG-928-G07]